MKNFKYMYRKKEDVAFDIERWLKSNYPPDTRVIADHPTRAYLPAWFNNAAYIGFGEDIRKDLEPLVDKVKPQLIYLNMQRADDSVITGISEYIPGRKSRIAAEFENKKGRFARWPGTKYVIYEIEKDKR